MAGRVTFLARPIQLKKKTGKLLDMKPFSGTYAKRHLNKAWNKFSYVPARLRTVAKLS